MTSTRPLFPYVQLLNSPPLLSYTTPAADADCDDSTLEGMLYQAHRAQVDHSLREDLSVSLSSSMSDRTGQPVGDRSGRPGEHRSSEAQIRTALDDQKEQILAQSQASLDRQPKFQSSSVEETLQRIMVQTNNDCRFRIFILTNSLHQPRLLAGRQDSRPRYVLVHIFLRKLCNGSKKWRWLIQWMI